MSVNALTTQQSNATRYENIIPDASAFNGTALTILLIDDYKPLLSLMKELLESYGFSVITGEDGDEAVELYKQRVNEIDIVITDINMPRVDGITACKQMLQINPNAKVLFMSFEYSSSCERELIGIGAKGFLEKPFTMAQLNKKLIAAVHA